jgi:hypothetical protein
VDAPRAPRRVWLTLHAGFIAPSAYFGAIGMSVARMSREVALLGIKRRAEQHPATSTLAGQR